MNIYMDNTNWVYKTELMFAKRSNINQAVVRIADASLVTFEWTVSGSEKGEAQSLKKYTARMKKICDLAGLAWTRIESVNATRYKCEAIRL
jgi:hypothetical protein